MGKTAVYAFWHSGLLLFMVVLKCLYGQNVFSVSVSLKCIEEYFKKNFRFVAFKPQN